jgi:dCTP deaminase
MILAKPEIRARVEAGAIRFEPALKEEQWRSASIDLRLGTRFTKLQGASGVKVAPHAGLGQLGMFWKTMDLPARNDFDQPNSLCLEPGEFILAMTHERVVIPNELIALVEGRSTYARLGLSMHQTAPWIQPGWAGHIVLEIKNQGPIRVELTPLVDRPCQLTFFQLTSCLPDDLAYGASACDRFVDQRHPLGCPSTAVATSTGLA